MNRYSLGIAAFVVLAIFLFYTRPVSVQVVGFEWKRTTSEFDWGLVYHYVPCAQVPEDALDREGNPLYEAANVVIVPVRRCEYYSYGWRYLYEVETSGSDKNAHWFEPDPADVGYEGRTFTEGREWYWVRVVDEKGSQYLIEVEEQEWWRFEERGIYVAGFDFLGNARRISADEISFGN